MSTVQTTQPQGTTTVSTGKGKAAKPTTGNHLLDVAQVVENLTRVQALHRADNLVETIDETYFELGGVLKLISEKSWFEGYDSFELFVQQKYNFAGRKARYLISIYDNLVTKQIPWELVKDLGWTKLKDLAPVLTQDNAEEWVAKVKDLTYLEMMALLKAQVSPTGEPSASTTSDSHTIKFKLKADQVEIVQKALAKAKGELNTQYDSVAIENICAGYVGGTISAAGQISPEMLFQQLGYNKVLDVFGAVFPEIDVKVTVPAAIAA